MKDRSFQSSTRTVPAGKVTFVVRNAGKKKHEFVVIRSDRHHHQLQAKGQQASEVGVKGEIEGFAPGGTKRLTLTLAPGKYVLICNLPGHYKAGQYLAFTVTPAAAPAAQTTNVTVSMFEMGFKLSATVVPRGTVIFKVVNDGKVPHDFRIERKGTRVPRFGSERDAHRGDLEARPVHVPLHGLGPRRRRDDRHAHRQVRQTDQGGLEMKKLMLVVTGIAALAFAATADGRGDAAAPLRPDRSGPDEPLARQERSQGLRSSSRQ